MDNIVAIQHILQQTKQNLKNTCDNCTTDMEVFVKTLTDEFCQVLEEKLQLVKEFNIKIANDINETIKNAQTNNDLVDVSSSVDAFCKTVLVSNHIYHQELPHIEETGDLGSELIAFASETRE